MSLSRFEGGAVCAELHEDVLCVARRMRDRRVGSVVVTRGGRPVGIVTDRDLVLRVMAEARDPTTTRVEDVVTYEAATVDACASIATAARTMRERGVRRLPIVREDGTITGIVTANDLVVLVSSEMADVGLAIAGGVDATESR